MNEFDRLKAVFTMNDDEIIYPVLFPKIEQMITLSFLTFIYSFSFHRESREQIRFIVEAYDGGSPSRTSSYTIVITLEDINDQSPYFEKPTY